MFSLHWYETLTLSAKISAIASNNGFWLLHELLISFVNQIMKAIL